LVLIEFKFRIEFNVVTPSQWLQDHSSVTPHLPCFGAARECRGRAIVGHLPVGPSPTSLLRGTTLDRPPCSTSPPPFKKSRPPPEPPFTISLLRVKIARLSTAPFPLYILSAAGHRGVATVGKSKPLLPLHPPHGEPSLRLPSSTIVDPSSLLVTSSSCRTSPPPLLVTISACRRCRLHTPSHRPAASVRTPPPHLARRYHRAPPVS
jgi:hypothetical protein